VNKKQTSGGIYIYTSGPEYATASRCGPDQAAAPHARNVADSHRAGGGTLGSDMQGKNYGSLLSSPRSCATCDSL
jgi:hypothetical protein